MKKTLIIVGIVILVLALAGAGAAWFYFLGNRVKDVPQANFQSGAGLTDKDPKEDAPLVASVSSELQIPWALAELPNNDLIFTERDGFVRIISRETGKKSDVLLEVDDLNFGEGGLLGLAVHPDYPTKPWIYIYYTYGTEASGRTKNQVVRYDFDGSKFTEQKVLLAEIPGAKFHDGGRLKFGPDGLLYIGTGDATIQDSAQDVNALSGKILRMSDEGEVPESNPFGNSYVYTLGHRNVQGFAWDNDGAMYATEHGSNAHDEVNKIAAGRNYGWPVITGTQTADGMETPLLESGSDTWAPSGVVFYNGSLYFAGLRGQALYQVDLSSEVPTLTAHFKREYGRMRDVVVGPDDFLYVLTNNRDGRGVPVDADDQILRVNPEKL